jgi:hypothetical protein
VAIILGLSVWHARNRRRPGWLASDEGRFAIYSGYALLTVALYWLVTAPTATAWEWALGNLWALAAMVAFVKGFESLRHAATRHAELAQQLETVAPSVDALPFQR